MTAVALEVTEKVARAGGPDPGAPFETLVATAGAYVWAGGPSDGHYVFEVGPRAAASGLAVIRLGGHREGAETAWQCAAREVHEEASLDIRPLAPPATYWARVKSGEPPYPTEDLAPARWVGLVPGEVPPVLAAWRSGGETGTLSVMFLARTDGRPVPAAEAHGLLLLRRSDVFRLTRESVTLGGFLSGGGKAVLRPGLPESEILIPFNQLRLLARLLELHPDL